MSEKKSYDKWAEEKKTPAWLLAAAKAYHRWDMGTQLSEGDFDAALDQVSNLPLGAPTTLDGKQ